VVHAGEPHELYAPCGISRKIEEVKSMDASIQSLGYGLLAFLFLTAVIAACTVGKAALKQYLRKTNQETKSRTEE
jgi:multisubunit Na+/H+ antiporter MnhG subunit